MRKFLSILLAVMMVLSTVSFAAPSAFKAIDAVIETPVADSAVEDTADLAAELPKDVSAYGQLIFELNFDEAPVGAFTENTYFRNLGFVNPESNNYNALNEHGYLENMTAYANREIAVRSEGNNYLKVSGGSGYAHISLDANTWANSGFYQTKDGVLTLTYDVYKGSLDGTGFSKTNPHTIRFTGGKGYNTEDTPKEDFSGATGEGWGTVVAQHDRTCFGNGGHEVKLTSVSQVGIIKLHGAGIVPNDVIGVDNIRLYWKPETVKVTVEANGESVVKEFSTLEPVAVSSFIDALGLGCLYNVTGAYIGDEKYEADDYITLGSDITVELEVEAIDSKYWAPEKGVMLFNVDFEVEELRTLNDEHWKPESRHWFDDYYKTPYSDVYMSHDLSEWGLYSNGGLQIMKDPADENNIVAGIENDANEGYPVLRIDTVNHTAKKHGFVEEPEGIFYLEYDMKDANGTLGTTERFGGRSSVSENEGLDKWASLEDVPSEYHANNKAPNVWRQNYAIYSAANLKRMGAVSETSFVKIHAAAPKGNSYYYDNIKLYWKPLTADVKIDTNYFDATLSKAKLEDVTTAGIKVSDLMDMAGLVYDEFKYSFKGLSFDEEGKNTLYGKNDTIYFPGDCKVYLILEEIDMSEWVDENGIILYDINFNNLANGTQIANYAKVSTFGRVNPYIDGSENWYLNISGFGTVANADYGVVENGALKFEKTGANQWAQIQISNEANGNTIIADGIITKFADMKLVSEVSGVTLGLTGYARKYNVATGLWEGSTNNQNSVHTLNTVVSGEWYSLSGSKTLEGQEYNSESCTIYLPTYPAAGGIGDFFYLDNLKLYWKPVNVNLTVYGGSNKDYEKQVITAPATATVEELAALLPGSAYGKITGFADLEGNKIDFFSAYSNASLVAIWTPWVEVEGGQEFAEDKKGVSENSMWKSGSYAYQADVGDGGADTTTAIHNMYGNSYWSTNGNFYRTLWTPQIGDSDIGVGDTEETVQTFSIPAGRTHKNAKTGQEDCIRENIKVSLASGNDAEYILVKYRYNNLPDLAELVANNKNPEGYEYTLSDDGYTINYTDRWGDEASASLKPAYGAKYYVEMQAGGYEYAGGMEFHQNELMVEGEWIYDFIPVSAKITENGAKTLLIQRMNIFHNEVIEIDYIHFVKTGDEEEDVVLPELGGGTAKPIKAPTTDTVVAVRPVAQSNSALRFKASVRKATAESVDDLGWIITTDNFWAGDWDSISIDAVNAENGAKVKAAYQIKDGEAQAKFFDTTNDAEPVFAAVLYNIPLKNMYDTILVRPFSKVGDTVKYGEVVDTTLYDVAMYPYIVFNEDYGYNDIDDLAYDVADYYETLEAAYEDGAYWFTEEYDDLSEGHKALIDDMLNYAVEQAYGA